MMVAKSKMVRSPNVSGMMLKEGEVTREVSRSSRSGAQDLVLQPRDNVIHYLDEGLGVWVKSEFAQTHANYLAFRVGLRYTRRC